MVYELLLHVLLVTRTWRLMVELLLHVLLVILYMAPNGL